MPSLLHLLLFFVGVLVISSVQSEEIDNDSLEVNDFLYGHNRNRDRYTTSRERYTNSRNRYTTPRNRYTTPSSRSFVCPAIYGRYPHETDCGRYYECRFGVPHLMKCDRNKLYDDKKERCNDRHKVDCDRKDRDKTTGHDGDEKELDHDETFKCPYIWGTFPHPTLCYKYYVCLYNIPSLFQCQGSKLFDTRSKKCIDHHAVKCGDRLEKDDLKTSKRPTSKLPITTPLPQIKTTLPQISTTTEEGFTFYCPFPNGRFIDPLDCSQYYECHLSHPTLYKCPRSTLYDERKEECRQDTKVNCGQRPGGIDEDNTKEEKIRCPYTWGSFPHPNDCSKYMICIYNVPTVLSCNKNNLFHAKYRRCIPAHKVDCDDRNNPDELTTKIPKTSADPSTIVTDPTTITTEAPTTTTSAPTTTISAPTTTTSAPTSTTSAPTTTTVAPTSAPTTTTVAPTSAPTTTTVAPTSAPTTTTVAPTSAPTTTTAAPTTTTTVAPTTTPGNPTTTSEPITKVTKPNTPPPTDCEEDDLDCIIDGTGDVKGWFDCPERYGHFAHGSSRQLFIHCDNYRPYVKKCADNTVFSPKYLVCMWV